MKDNCLSALIIPQLDQNQPTSEIKMTPLDSSISPVTKNKNTKNKKLKIITNRINAVEENYERWDELTDAISRLMDGSDEEIESHKRVFNLLKSLVPKFMNFTESPKDANLIDQIRHFNLDAATIALKIIKNARDINCDVKSNRFGNLFVGLDEMNQNLTKKVS